MNIQLPVSGENFVWRGPGTPSLRNLGSEARRIGQLLIQGQFRASFNRTISTASNLWNFNLQPAKSISAVCPCCGWQGPAFLATANWRAIAPQSRCPRCDSRSRHRGLTVLMPRILERKPEGPILMFAPEPSLLPQLQSRPGDVLHTTDYLRQDVDYPGEDIQRLSFADNSYALLLCNHVIEHVPDDQQAFIECARVLRPGGLAVFTIPGNYDKEETWYFDKPDDNGHYRHYGRDVVQKMSRAFAEVEMVDMGAGADPRWHIRPRDYAFVCRK